MLAAMAIRQMRNCMPERLRKHAGILKKEDVAQNLGRPISVGNGRSIMLRFRSRQATRNYAKKLRRRTNKIAGGTDADYAAVTGDYTTMVTLIPAGGGFNSVSSCGDAAVIGKDAGGNTTMVTTAMLEKPPGLALVSRSSIEIGAVTRHTIMITKIAATTDIYGQCGPARLSIARDMNIGSVRLSIASEVGSEVDDADWCLTSCSRWKTMEGKWKEEEEGKLMIQNIGLVVVLYWLFIGPALVSYWY